MVDDDDMAAAFSSYQMQVARDEDPKIRTYLRENQISPGEYLKNFYDRTYGRSIRRDITRYVQNDQHRHTCERVLGLRAESAAITEQARIPGQSQSSPEGEQPQQTMTVAEALQVIDAGGRTLSEAVHDYTRQLYEELDEGWINGYAEVDDVNDIWAEIKREVGESWDELKNLTGIGDRRNPDSVAYQMMKDAYREIGGSLTEDLAEGLNDEELAQCHIRNAPRLSRQPQQGEEQSGTQQEATTAADEAVSAAVNVALTAKADEVFAALSGLSYLSRDEHFEAVRDLIGEARTMQAEDGSGASLTQVYQDKYGITLDAHCSRVAMAAARVPPGQAGQGRDPQALAALMGVSIAAIPAADPQAQEGEPDPDLVNTGFTAAQAQSIAADMWEAVQSGALEHVFRLYAQRQASAEEQRVIDYHFRQITGGIDWRFYFHQAQQAQYGRGLTTGLEGADGEGRTSVFVTTSASELQTGIDISGTGGLDAVTKVSALVRDRNMDGLFRAVEQLTEQERVTVLNNDTLINDIEDFCDEEAWDRVYKTLTGQADLYDRLSSRAQGSYGFWQWADGTDEEGIREDIKEYIRQQREIRIPQLRNSLLPKPIAELSAGEMEGMLDGLQPGTSAQINTFVEEASDDPEQQQRDRLDILRRTLAGVVDDQAVELFRLELMRMATDPAIRGILQDEMDGVDLARSESIFFNDGQESHDAHFSTEGDWTEDESRMLQALRDMTPEQRQEVANDPDFRASLMRSITSEGEFNEAMALLGSQAAAGASDPIVELDRMTHSRTGWGSLTRSERDILDKVASLNADQFRQLMADPELQAQIRAVLDREEQEQFDQIIGFSDITADTSEVSA
ncbi:MAG: hypothetical protein KJO07_03065, partial [Deltaproteobacteria bacterium]|nr:hypothetical protein [Deltaproteobacteria bacterium]